MLENQATNLLEPEPGGELEAIDRLARDVEHDLNNALTLIEHTLRSPGALATGAVGDAEVEDLEHMVERAALAAQQLRDVVGLGLSRRLRDPAPELLRPRRVLLVDDDGFVRKLARRILLAEGFEVVDCSSPAEALALDASTFDLLLTDVLLPGMSGIELVEELRRRGEEPPALLTSGYCDDISVRSGEGTLAFIPKPFTAAELVAAVRRVLQRQVSAG